ncbi:MAG: hypothetical protein QW434_06160 [Pyrobaculum sp.]
MAATVKAACVKVALPEAFELPRKFGVSRCVSRRALFTALTQ